MLSSMSSKQHATAADLAGLERYEIIRGALVQKAAPSFEHGAQQGRIAGALYGFWGRGGDGRPGGWWLGTEVEIELETHEVYLPDIAGWRIERVPAPPSGQPVRVAPDWVCEILSPSTAQRDLGHKRDIYHRAGIGHYWVVHPLEHTLTVLRWQSDGYEQVLAANPSGMLRVEPFDAIALDFADIFGVHSQAS